ncbi:MAG: A/G-specific adenine glycosylase [Lentisphaerae bacterium]|nr:A/G-specific adenine glycosylase [Lentisphaerota bacterium]
MKKTLPDVIPSATWVSALLRWFDRHRREMPWRNRPTPYNVWISEIMLQQTQVATVIPYFRRFIRRFPDVKTLAAAKPDAVLKLWEGLGYYSRARNLHETARRVIRDFGGRIPSAPDALKALPGIGDYTAGAILSIAFHQPAPAVDGNVLRVFSRFWGLRAELRSPVLKKTVFQRLSPIIHRANPSHFNQAMMELGALVCRPRNPLCPECPLRETCFAFAHELTYLLPVREKSVRIPHYRVAVGIVRRNGRLLIAQRPYDAMLGGLWEFPGGRRQAGETLRETARREIREETGLTVRVGETLGTVRHAYSHFTVTIAAFLCEAGRGRARPVASLRVRWVFPGELRRYAWPSASRKIIALLQKRPA